MIAAPQPLITAGIDVGGARKGFHAVALCDGAHHSQHTSKDAAEIAKWCRDVIQAQVIAIDAPCCWRSTREARLSERQLLRLSPAFSPPRARRP